MSLKTELYKSLIPEVQRRLEDNRKKLRLLIWVKSLFQKKISISKINFSNQQRNVILSANSLFHQNKLPDLIEFAGKIFETTVSSTYHPNKLKTMPPDIYNELVRLQSTVADLGDSDEFTKMDVILAIDKYECEKIELKEIYSELLDKAYPNRKDKRDKWLDVCMGSPPRVASKIRLNRFGQIVTNRKNESTT